ncbi:hypothetical protein CBM2586_A10839 [Cupriavidus phytorum]|uniref:Uncharacterized protein n=1 Tax=Cupriavidus taiwanensis TaxID=164546 RepID=A0A375BBI2_9BURK|nr:hypothetical protein CBM2586_A10839 [Cupriavidus taiwanensis]
MAHHDAPRKAQTVRQPARMGAAPDPTPHQRRGARVFRETPKCGNVRNVCYIRHTITPEPVYKRPRQAAADKRLTIRPTASSQNNKACRGASGRTTGAAHYFVANARGKSDE